MKSRPERLSKRSGLPLKEGCCSLKIRRVESALLMESEHESFGVACEHRAISNALIASTDFNRERAWLWRNPQPSKKRVGKYGEREYSNIDTSLVAGCR
jgi:hypothetical protein